MRSETQAFIDKLLTPGTEYSPIPFWFLNDDLDMDELRRQLMDFKKKGVDGVVLHPRIGLPESLPYLSEAYFTAIRFIVETASSLDMQIVLYDEGMYPSGSAHGEVVRKNADFASKGITITTKPNGRKVIAALGDGRTIVQDFTKGTIRGIHFGEDDGEAGAPASADILNPDAVALFLQLTHDQYFKHLGPFFGNTIIGFFTDEPCVMGRNTQGFFPWTDRLTEIALAHHIDLRDLAALFDDEENDTIRRYEKIVKDQLMQAYYKQLYDWCEGHGVALIGHPEKSDDIDELSYFHIPGQDLVFRRVSPEMGGLIGLDSVQAKCSSDAARHMSRRRNANECFGVCALPDDPFHLSADDMKWFIDWLGVRGVNLFIPHAFYYSVRDRRRDERPPDVGPNSIHWENYKQWSDYMKRLSFIMTDAKNTAEVAVICESGNMPADALAPFYENQVEFNYFTKAFVEPGQPLGAAGYEYPYYLADAPLDVQAVRITAWEDIQSRDFMPDRNLPDLRATHLVKEGLHMYFFTNEGEETLLVTGSVSVSGQPVYVDLWNGTSQETAKVLVGQRTRVDFELKRRQSLLVIIEEQCGDKGER